MENLPNDKYELLEMEQFLEKYELHKMRNQVLDRAFYLVIAAVGLVAALAWDDALHSMFDAWLGGTDTLTGKFLYALLITLIAAVVSVLFGRRFAKHKKSSGNK